MRDSQNTSKFVHIYDEINYIHQVSLVTTCKREFRLTTMMFYVRKIHELKNIRILKQDVVTKNLVK